ncbi:hypothetical protein FPV16_17580 [Methylobacterium sp. W2]|uniref:hypothetical protein n=1 Tax=Methylobacterium sp. W2 TaxID=2598107 RepID=UPI001D0CDCF2|nr:hypothetical protein [Methylobacterium sp. W2]MCC0807998.1 hypothetical protein [Methylobacterium sp. W2]
MADKVIGAAESDRSPEALLKQAVSGAKAKPATVPEKRRRLPLFTPLFAGVTAAALMIGVTVGAGTMSIVSQKAEPSSEKLAQIQSRLDIRQADVAQLQADIEKLGKVLAQVQDATEVVRSEAKNRSATLNDRIGKSEQVIVSKVTSLADRQDQTERDQTAKIAALTSQLEKRTMAATPAIPVAPPQAAKAHQPEPTETGSLPDKAKASTPAVIESWAVREVYNGIAVIEDRRHRLVEVGPGDTIPGVGKVDSVERRGRSWAVATKQGLIINQTW